MAVVFLGDRDPFDMRDFGWGTPPTVSGSIFRNTASEIDVAYSNGNLGIDLGTFGVVNGQVTGTANSAALFSSQGNLIAGITGASVPTSTLFNHTPAEVMTVALGGNDIIVAGAAADTMFGYGGNDTIIGTSGAAVMLAGPGTDWLVGGTGRTYMGMQPHAGTDILFVGTGGTTIAGAVGAGLSIDLVAGFNPARDTIGLVAGTGGVTTAQQALAHTSSDGHGNTIVSIGPEFMVLAGISPGQISAGNFLLV